MRDLDFVSINVEQSKRDIVISPEFIVNGRCNDLMIRGKAFYAVYDKESGFWSRDENLVVDIVDEMLDKKAEDLSKNEYFGDCRIKIKYMSKFSTNSWNSWQKYCKSLPDHWKQLDTKIMFANDKIKKTDYMTHVLPYPLEDTKTPAYDELISTLYNEENRKKLEWAVGCIIAGDSKWIQKFLVLYGDPGSGKSTVLNIIEQLFEGYWSSFESKTLASNADFALESFRNNPLLAIEHDGDLSHIEDNTRLNSIVSHETMVVNEKFKAKYDMSFQTFLFMASNKPVKITDSKSGLLRRLIDVNPTGDKISESRYYELKDKLRFELGGIAYRCLQVYKECGANYYSHYIPTSMIEETNDFYNFVEDNYGAFMDHQEEMTLQIAWRMYKEYCDEANVRYPYTRMAFKNELKNYYADYKDRYDGKYSVYFGFLKDKFRYENKKGPDKIVTIPDWLSMQLQPSILDKALADYPAQYASAKETPAISWDKCATTLKELNTSELHYVRGPLNLIVIDFDLKDEKGEKCYEKNLEEASKWPATYAEVSKGGAGIHLHYWYNGDISRLSHLYAPEIEIKVFTGKSALRRKLSLCNASEIAFISSGLPLREEKKVIKGKVIKSEKGLREQIKRNLNKEVMGYTKPSIDLIYKILDDFYKTGANYDVTDLRPAVQAFALNSTHNAEYCLKIVGKMKFKSEESSENVENYDSEKPIVFFDVEVFPNAFIVCWKKQGKGTTLVKWFNPEPHLIEDLIKNRLIGFNNRNYDNHMLYARMMGYTNEQIFRLSQRIIVEKDRNAFFGEAYNLSYSDVYDFLNGDNRMSLKKWEIKLGIPHKEFNWPWDKPLPEEMWEDCASYCCNDVLATEAVFDANSSDWSARQILAELSGLTVNDTTNSHTSQIIIGKNPHPQKEFVYTDLSTLFPGYRFDPYGIPKEEYDQPEEIVTGKSIYRGEDPGEGGYVYANPGMYTNIALLDVESMHPNSARLLNIFGPYTQNFVDILQLRLGIKHKRYEEVQHLFDGRIAKYLGDKSAAKSLAYALKIAINAVYGLTSAKFENKLRDPRNVDNIVAKRGALFMINLKHEVQNRGFKVVHIKTDSIKIADATPEIIQFVKEYGHEYGYNFDHEATYARMCLVNDAVYIAKLDTAEHCQKMYGYIPEENEENGSKWTATGKQFQVPYVFKTLFSKEKIVFEDLCEVMSGNGDLYLDMNERLIELPFQDEDEEIPHDYRFIGKVGYFCPVMIGCGGGILRRKSIDKKTGKEKYAAPSGTLKKNKDPYRWMEADMVKNLNLEDKIDMRYFDELACDARDNIAKYGNFEWFVSEDDVPEYMFIPENSPEEVPFETLMNPPVSAVA